MSVGMKIQLNLYETKIGGVCLFNLLCIVLFLIMQTGTQQESCDHSIHSQGIIDCKAFVLSYKNLLNRKPRYNVRNIDKLLL